MPVTHREHRGGEGKEREIADINEGYQGMEKRMPREHCP